MKHELLPLFVAAGLSDSRIVRHYGVAPLTVLRWRKAEGLATQWKPKVVEHGESAYKKRGCRCDVCRAANTKAQQTGNVRRRALTEANGGIAPIARHGLSTGRNWGCWCEVCRGAIKAANDAWTATHRRAG
ncbi:hypothetical protein ABIQ69_11385 [Agromyces sp. G08B096]|uniref:Uncharacterized protein n=1 Tax=Agromyces sp. G08B096 TaxID=3156399 RepID=A0AAU7W5E2_9MICO